MLLPAPGRLLIAGEMLDDPNFMRSVVYLIEHHEHGTLGLVINRPLDIPLSDLWEDCPPLLADQRRCGEGGPVERNKGLLLHAFSNLPEAYDLGSGILVGGNLRALQKRMAAEGKVPGIRGPRLFLGHAGWGPGQLDIELQQGAWVIREGDPALLLNHTPPADLWNDLIDAGPSASPPSVN